MKIFSNMRPATIVGAAAILVFAASPALSRGGPHGNGNAAANFGGMSNSHISAQGRINTNGPNATDRSFGRDRVDDRIALRDRTDVTRRDRDELDINGRGANRAGFCPPGQAKKSGLGSRFNC